MVERHYLKLTFDFHINKKILAENAEVSTKRLRNKIAGYATYLMKRIQKGPVKRISLKIQEEVGNCDVGKRKKTRLHPREVKDRFGRTGWSWPENIRPLEVLSFVTQGHLFQTCLPSSELSPLRRKKEKKDLPEREKDLPLPLIKCFHCRLNEATVKPRHSKALWVIWSN